MYKTRSDRQFVGRLIYSVLTEQRKVLDAIKLFPETKDESILCAYHALVHYSADEDIRYKDIEYRDAQDDYLEYLAQVLSEGNPIPQNIIAEYKPYYKDVSHTWKEGIEGFWEEFKRFINI
ncbi:MAG: hypothetical protein MJ231_00455 [bacterium]|nr:hypothetical protein [bacterium]